MKYFTSDWWASGCEEPPDVFERYNAYLSSVRTRLPAAMVDFNARHTLHDSRLESTVCDFDNRTVGMRLLGWDQVFERRVHYKLCFSGMSRFHQAVPICECIEPELGDLGYVEIEVIEPALEMRMLFASSAEFRINFTDFAFEAFEV